MHPNLGAIGSRDTAVVRRLHDALGGDAKVVHLERARLRQLAALIEAHDVHVVQVD